MILDSAAPDLEPIHVPHGMYRERDLEDIVEARLRRRSASMDVFRQPWWGSVGRPDLVTIERVADGVEVTVFELKVVPIGWRALAQLDRYVIAALRGAVDLDVPVRISGVLCGFTFRPIPRQPAYLSLWPVRMVD